jgi:hypothetical protein
MAGSASRRARREGSEVEPKLDTAEEASRVVAALMREYGTYDHAVDVVSAFEFLFTVPSDMAATVAHFERFPRIPRSDAGDPDTPDFTVLFTDGTALVGEISRLSLRPESADSACEQLLRYSRLTQVPDASGHFTAVTDVDVMQLVPPDVGPDAVDRIITERMLNPDHPFKPAKAPCIVQYIRDPDRYMFQRLNDPTNGTIEGHEREPHIGARIRKINVPASRFVGIKGNKKFMNDPIKPLYLAVILYIYVWSTEQKGRVGEVTVNPASTAKTLRAWYGAGTASDVRNAMGLLVSAGLAVDNRDGTFTVAKPPRSRSEHDLARVIAQRSADKARPVVRPKRTAAAAPENQLTLFD